MDRQAAWELLNEYTKNPNLIKHALAVEAAMRAYARKFGEDEELWGIVGLLHDFDYEGREWTAGCNPAEVHPYWGARLLRERGYPEEVVYAILSHADYLPDYPRRSRLDRTLFAVDELTGFLVAVALVRPDRSLHSVEVRSVRKKLKDKAFAAAVSREDIRKGPAELGIDLDEHIAFVIEAMRSIAGELGLAGR